jgi:hypothetical protein
MARNKTGEPCPICGGDNRFVQISNPRTGRGPFRWCRHCHYTEPINSKDDIGAIPERLTLTPEQQQQAHHGYTAVARKCAEYLWTPAGAPYLDYFHSRGLHDATIHDLSLGCHIDTWRDGVGPELWHQDKAAYDGATLGGLLAPQGKPKNLLRGVITFPYSRNGICTTMRTRKLDPGDGTKYYSPAVALYAGATPTLFNQDILNKTDKVILTEGEIKAALVYQAWLEGQLSMPAVAQPGIGYLPEAFLDALANKTVYLIYDSEERQDPFVLSPGERFTIHNGLKLTGLDIKHMLEAKQQALHVASKPRDKDEDEINRLQEEISQLQAKLERIKARNIRVKVVRLPRPADVAKVDLDSFILQEGPNVLQHLIDSALSFEEWHEQHNGGGYRYDRGGMWQGNKRLANYQVRITENIVKDDDIEQIAFLRVELQAPNGLRRTVDISSKDWADERKAIQAIRSNLHDNTWIDENTATLKAIKALSRYGDDPVRRTVYTCTGWHTINGRWHFLVPDGAITGGGIVASLSSEIAANTPGNHYALCGAGNAAEGAQAILSFLRGDVCSQVIATSLLAHMVQAVLHRFIEDGNRCLFWPYGESGVLKTATVRAILSSFGSRFTAERADGAPVPKWDSTANGLEQVAFRYQDLPTLFDDYKQGGTRDQTLKLFLHRYSESAGRTRSTRDRTIDRPYPARCLVIGTGEDKLSGDFGAAGRIITLQFQRNTVNPDKLAKIQHAGASGHLAAFMREFIQAVSIHLDHKGPDGLKKHLHGLIEEDDTNHPVHRRTVSTLRHNRMAWLLFTKWMQAAGYCSEEDRTALDVAHKQAIDVLTQRQAGDQKDSKPSEIFLNVIREALITGEVILEEEHASAETEESPDFRRPERIIGFYHKGCIALQPEKTFSFVQQRLKGRELQFTPTAIYNQLDNDGYIAAKDEKYGKPTKVIWSPSQQKSVRMLLLKPEALNAPTDPDENTDEILTPLHTPYTSSVRQDSALESDKQDSLHSLHQNKENPVSVAFTSPDEDTSNVKPSPAYRCKDVRTNGLEHSDAVKPPYTQCVRQDMQGVRMPVPGSSNGNGHSPPSEKPSRRHDADYWCSQFDQCLKEGRLRHAETVVSILWELDRTKAERKARQLEATQHGEEVGE